MSQAVCGYTEQGVVEKGYGKVKGDSAYRYNNFDKYIKIRKY